MIIVKQISDCYVYELWDGQVMYQEIWVNVNCRLSLEDIMYEHKRLRYLGPCDVEISQN